MCYNVHMDERNRSSVVKREMMKFNWDQAGMPATLVSRLERRELSEFKSVLNDANNHVRSTIDAESMAQELMESGRGDLVEMVRELTTALANAERELENANRRHERLSADLARRGIRIDESGAEAPEDSPPRREPESILEGMDEWEEWDRRFKSLLG